MRVGKTAPIAVFSAIVGAAAALSGWNILANRVPGRDRFEPARRAVRSITSSTEIGVSKLRLAELVRDLATELALLKDGSLADEEQRLLNGYEIVLKVYIDSLEFWEWPTHDVYGRKVSSFREDDPTALRIIESYRLPTVPFDHGIKCTPHTSLQTIWQAGQAAASQIARTRSP